MVVFQKFKGKNRYLQAQNFEFGRKNDFEFFSGMKFQLIIE